jgi:hypothetical protein
MYLLYCMVEKMRHQSDPRGSQQLMSYLIVNFSSVNNFPVITPAEGNVEAKEIDKT